MNAPTSAAAARKPLAVKSELEAEISDLLDPEGQKLPAQIEDDGERIRSLVARLTSNSRLTNSKGSGLISLPQFDNYKNS